MSAVLACPGCGKSLLIPVNAAGPLRCPACKSVLPGSAPVRTVAGPPVISLPAPSSNNLDWLRLERSWGAEGAPKREFPGFEVIELVGQGGMGEVYKARQLRLDRVVALKVIRDTLLDNPDAIRRFQREARAAARLSHSNIVAIHDAVEVEGVHFLVMEYVQGTDLGALIRQRGPLSVVQACEWVRQAALGLGHAHERGLVHRDIKPGNLLVTADGALVKILDMGLARLEPVGDQTRRNTRLTQLGMVLGTPAYLPPEQALNPGKADARSDIYSLGCTLYHLLTGRPPFPGPSMEEFLHQHLSVEPEPVESLRPTLPPGLGSVLRRMLAKQPEDRFPTAGAVAEASRPYCQVTVSSSPETPCREETGEAGRETVTYYPAPRTADRRPGPRMADQGAAPRRTSRRSRLIWVGGMIGLVLLGFLVFFLAWPRNTSEKTAASGPLVPLPVNREENKPAPPTPPVPAPAPAPAPAARPKKSLPVNFANTKNFAFAGDVFTIAWAGNPVSITIRGTVVAGKYVPFSIDIRDGGEGGNYRSLEEVSEEYREAVQAMLR